MSATIGLPQFNHIDINGFKTHLYALLKNHLDQINTLLKENHHFTWDNLMYPLDDLDDELERFWSPFSHLHSLWIPKHYANVMMPACLYYQPMSQQLSESSFV